MDANTHILLLGGSLEARQLAEAFSARNLRYTVWLSEPPRGPAPLPQVPQLRRFESAGAMRHAVREGGFTAVVDASHVFDGLVTEQAHAAATALGLPFARVERPAWQIGAKPRWCAAADDAAANAMIAQGARVFCATGWDSLPAYAPFRGEVLLLRQTRRHRRVPPYPFVELVFGEPPFDAADEAALFRARRVDVLICRNLGGQASRPKLDAAEALGMEVILIDRPAAPAGVQAIDDVEAARAWVDAL